MRTKGLCEFGLPSVGIEGEGCHEPQKGSGGSCLGNDLGSHNMCRDNRSVDHTQGLKALKKLSWRSTPRDWKSQRPNSDDYEMVCNVVDIIFAGTQRPGKWIKLSLHTCGLMCVCVFLSLLTVLCRLCWPTISRLCKSKNVISYNLKMHQSIVRLWCHYFIDQNHS